jgi:predicted ATPase
LEGSDEDQLIDLIDEAIRAHVITPVPAAGERFTFAHALIRETLYDELTGPRRACFHRRVGEALEKLTEGSPKPPVADLAHHFLQAAPAGRPEKAIHYAIMAGDAAVAALVFEEAIRFYDMAMRTLESQPREETSAQKATVYTRRALAFRALGQWGPQKQEVERALECIDPQQTERRAELTLMLADAAFYLLDIPGQERWASAALAQQVGRGDIAADATGWLARCQQAKGDVNGAIELDHRAATFTGAPGRITRMHGGHSLYLAGAV